MYIYKSDFACSLCASDTSTSCLAGKSVASTLQVILWFNGH